MPVGGVAFGEGPDNPSSGDAARDLRVVDDVELIVVVDELVMKRLAEDDPDCHQKKAGQEQDDVTIAAQGP